MDAAVVAGVAIVALIAGAILGWVFATRQIAPLKAERDSRASEGEDWRVKFNEAVVNLAAEAEKTKRLADVEAQLSAERESTAALREKVAAFERGEQEREKAFEDRLKELREAKDLLAAQFSEIGTKLLGDARKAFLEQADEKFTQAVSPVESLLKSYEKKLETIEKERVDHYAGIREVVEQVRVGQGQVRDEARTLSTALRYAPKMRAALGEQSLQNVLEKAGLSPFADFKTEVSVEGSDGRIRPDVVVRLPGERQLIIDAKCSLNAYVDACNEVDDEKRKKLWEKHASSIRQHAQQLGSKAYWAQFGESTDYAIMYIPGEQFLTAALEQDDELWQWAFEKRVILATPQNLIAIVGTVATMWKRQQLNERAEEIASLGKELHSRLATMADHMSRMGKNLQTANTAYNQMVGSFESQVFTQARRFEQLGAGSAKDLDTPVMIEASPRPLTKLAVVPTNPQKDSSSPDDTEAVEA